VCVLRRLPPPSSWRRPWPLLLLSTSRSSPLIFKDSDSLAELTVPVPIFLLPGPSLSHAGSPGSLPASVPRQFGPRWSEQRASFLSMEIVLPLPKWLAALLPLLPLFVGNPFSYSRGTSVSCPISASDEAFLPFRSLFLAPPMSLSMRQTGVPFTPIQVL